MLLRELGEDSVVAIGQAAHAWVSGQIAREWGNARFGAVEPYEEVCLGAEQHDIGMALWDTEPTLNPATGRPHSFIEMPLPLHLELWGMAPWRIVTQSRYAALLVSMHGTALYERRDLDRLEPRSAELIRAYLRDQHAIQRRLRDQLRADDDEIARNQKLVFCWDWLSLALCLRWAPNRFEGVPSADGAVALALEPTETGDVVRVDPWPFRDSRVELRTEGRVLRGRFDDESDMRAALDVAEWVTLRFVLTPR